MAASQFGSGDAFRVFLCCVVIGENIQLTRFVLAGAATRVVVGE